MPLAISTYKDFLNALWDLGPKLPEVMAKVQHMVQDAQDIATILGVFAAEPDAKAIAKTDAFIEGKGITADVLAVETNIVAALPVPDDKVAAIGDGTFLRLIWTFVQANPDLLKFLLSLLMAKKA